ncbi:hypothetical protein L6164_014704 [Bauhinia variegata]|uniref:Uncharacterized protein n=1 Tax=Bauhinia variegata TaxID=167791 RepID=A0ACB9NLV7_BAUVA|nr:hypothetical protein L6164_014704 [Bauhinia variegata]
MEGRDAYKKGLWNVEEDKILMDYIKKHGIGRWNRIPKVSGLKRCGKSCRLRWMNYLSPNVKRGDFSAEEEDLIIRLHSLLGNRWSLIAGRVPGRTDNQVKNYWNTRLSRKLGVKEGKTKVSAFPNTLTNIEPKENSNSPSGSNSKSLGPLDCNSSCAGDEVAVEPDNSLQACSLGTQDFKDSMQDTITGEDDFENNLWFSNTAFDLCTPFLSEPFDGLDWPAL